MTKETKKKVARNILIAMGTAVLTIMAIVNLKGLVVMLVFCGLAILLMWCVSTLLD